MIFALATDEGTLFVFPSSADAIAYCEGIDVEDGAWRFWDERGTCLAAQFLTPNHRGRFSVGNGMYQLVPDASADHLAVALDTIKHLEANPRFASLAAVRAHLVATGTTQAHGA